MRRASLTIVLLWIPLLTTLSSFTRTLPPSSGPAARFLAAPPETLHSYRATRHLTAGNTRFNRSAWIDVETSFDAGEFSYRVIAQDGSPMVIRKALLPVLEGERRALAHASEAALTDVNYDFADDGVENDWARIRIVPRRRDAMLVNGWLYVSQDSADLVEIQGRLVKPPSFWVSRVGIVRRYARVAGVRVPVWTESTASVRFAGESTFSMRYTYQMVNGIVVAPDAVK